MPQTFYIESDEEIISVIGRLRKSSAELNYFVIPKRALILQSIVNLRLFQREAQKLGKKIILVTQDEVGQNLAKKIGMPTENYSDDFSQKNGHLELTSAPAEGPRVPSMDSPQTALPKQVRPIPRSDSIGSAEFNQFGPESIQTRPGPVPEISQKAETDLHVRVRAGAPGSQTSLNSLRSTPASPATRLPSAMPGAPAARVAAFRDPQAQKNGTERLKKFFSPDFPERTASSRTPSEPQLPPVASTARPDKKNTRYIFLILGGLSLVSLFAVAAYLFFPTAEIAVTPYKTSRFVNMEFEGSTGTFVSGAQALPVRILEKEETVSVTVEATGTSANSNQKAKGRLTIYNAFSAEPQTLVATTRFETADGKIFRLVESVTVPGMKNNSPASIEAEVIADQSGTAYNIEPSDFSIPGFKGSAKFAKFSARSARAMIGGGDGGTEMKVVAPADIERAKKEAQEKARSEFLVAAASQASGEEKILENALEVTPLGTAEPPSAGTLASSFDFENTYRVRAFVIPEGVIRKQAEEEGALTIENIRFVPAGITLTYEGSIPKFSDGRVDLKVQALLDLRSDIKLEELRERLLDRNEAGITEILPEFPEVKKIEVRFHPPGLVSTVPGNKDRVTLVERPAEEPAQ